MGLSHKLAPAVTGHDWDGGWVWTKTGCKTSDLELKDTYMLQGDEVVTKRTIYYSIGVFKRHCLFYAFSLLAPVSHTAGIHWKFLHCGVSGSFFAVQP